MAEPTARDRCWTYALNLAVKKGKTVKPADIAEYAGVSERTARKVLLVMSDAGWLARRTKPDGRVEYIGEAGIYVDDEI